MRLTMGGEPTFVSIDDRDARRVEHRRRSGRRKRRQAADLLQRLRDRFAPGGLLHFGQGKWYPGEPLPRWAFGCYWRHGRRAALDGPGALRRRGRATTAHGADEAAAVRRGAGRAARGRPGVTRCRATRTCGTTCGRSGGCRSTSIRSTSKLDDPEERARLARVFEQGLGDGRRLRAAAAAAAAAADRRGRAAPWSCGREHLFLIPGDSPMGFRLPLDSLPWEAAGQPRQLVHELRPVRPAAPLPPRPQADEPAAGAIAAADAARGRTGASTPRPAGPSVVRTALCVEPRDGRLHVFMPPVESLEDYLDLVAAVEATAAELRHAGAARGLQAAARPRGCSTSRSRPTPA